MGKGGFPMATPKGGKKGGKGKPVKPAKPC